MFFYLWVIIELLQYYFYDSTNQCENKITKLLVPIQSIMHMLLSLLRSQQIQNTEQTENTKNRGRQNSSFPKEQIKNILTCINLFEQNNDQKRIGDTNVGVRWYCSKSGLCCFKKLGFNNTLIRNIVTMIKQIFDGMLVLYLAGQKQSRLGSFYCQLYAQWPFKENVQPTIFSVIS